MRSYPFRILTLAALLLGFASCQSSSWSFPPERNGPPFAEAFPEASILLETKNVTNLRKKLLRCPLPETDEHHEQLLELVASAESVRAENLALLTEAVALPVRSGDKAELESGSGSHTYITIGGSPVTAFSRQEGPYSHYIDDLLLLGATKLEDPNATNLGRLMAVTQKRETVSQLYELLGAECDDGSAKALEDMLRSNRFDEVRNDLLVGVLVPRGGIDQERAEAGLDGLSFDDARTRFLEAWMPTVADFDGERLPYMIGTFSFDDGRESAVRAATQSPGATFDGVNAKKCIEKFAFDEGRCNAMRSLAPYARIQNPTLLPDLIGVASFDEGRTEILRSALGSLSHSEALPAAVAKDCLEEFSFDEGRENALEILAPEIQFESFQEVLELLEVASFDEGRVNMLRSVAPRTSALNGSARDLKDILDAFSFDDGRTQALGLVGTGFQELPSGELWDALDEAYSFSSGRKEGAKKLALR